MNLKTTKKTCKPKLFGLNNDMLTFTLYSLCRTSPLKGAPTTGARTQLMSAGAEAQQSSQPELKLSDSCVKVRFSSKMNAKPHVCLCECVIRFLQTCINRI